MNAQEIIALENQYVVHTYNRPGFVLDRGEGVYVYDTEGKAYLDFLGGIAVNALGHGHPAVQRAIQEQAPKLMHVSNLYHTAPHALLARDLVETLQVEGTRGSNVGLVMVNRTRTASTYTRTEIEQQVGRELFALITPAPEIAFLANKQGKPILLSQPGTAIASQIKQLSGKVT